MHTTLSTLKSDVTRPSSAFNRYDADQQTAILQAVANLGEIVLEFDALLSKFESLGRPGRSTWDVLKFGDAPLTEIRTKVTTHLAVLNVLL